MKATLNFAEAAEYLNVSSSSLSDLSAIGEIPGAKISKEWVFRLEDLDAYLAQKIREQTEARREAYRLGNGKKVQSVVTDIRHGRRKEPPLLPGMEKVPVTA
ncbi:MAG: helix-turn-helix domain-containing protein [Gallionella sp.]|nr:helix-turn-helix domain-containing protein [Gallionella sp.]NCS74909.1 helix-turn-helix domain-containing protein [Gallionella sp.]